MHLDSKGLLLMERRRDQMGRVLETTGQGCWERLTAAGLPGSVHGFVGPKPAGETCMRSCEVATGRGFIVLFRN